LLLITAFYCEEKNRSSWSERILHTHRARIISGSSNCRLVKQGDPPETITHSKRHIQTRHQPARGHHGSPSCVLG
ncbi:hypothetical protein XENOCAPTIV_002714, partial [Xenoophorus captivus]